MHDNAHSASGRMPTRRPCPWPRRGRPQRVASLTALRSSGARGRGRHRNASTPGHDEESASCAHDFLPSSRVTASRGGHLHAIDVVLDRHAGPASTNTTTSRRASWVRFGQDRRRSSRDARRSTGPSPGCTTSTCRRRHRRRLERDDAEERADVATATDPARGGETPRRRAEFRRRLAVPRGIAPLAKQLLSTLLAPLGIFLRAGHQIIERGTGGFQ